MKAIVRVPTDKSKFAISTPSYSDSLVDEMADLDGTVITVRQFAGSSWFEQTSGDQEWVWHKSWLEFIKDS